MNGAMYRIWHNNIALPPVKILAEITVYVGGRYCVGNILYVFCKDMVLQHSLKCDKICFPVCETEKNLAPSPKIKLQTSQNLFPSLSADD